MNHNCRLARAGTSVDAVWRRDGDELLVTPAGGLPAVIVLAEVSAISGDGFSIRFGTPDGEIGLERLGADGPTLLQELRRDWPPVRAQALRLNGGQAIGKVFAGHIESPTHHGAFRGFLIRDRLIFAVDGVDVSPLFLADCASISFDEASFTVRCTGWRGAVTTFSRLAGETKAFLDVLRLAREQLAMEAYTTLQQWLPSLSGGARAKAAAHWLPGRMLSMAELEQLAPGFEAAFAASWLAHLRRADEGKAMMTGVAAADRYLAFAPADRTLDPEATPGGQPQLIWLLVRSGQEWALELLSQGNYATYLFKGDVDFPSHVEGIMHMPEFSREALYNPLTDLVEQRSKYAIAARDLPLLQDLRAAFSGRRIHASKNAQAKGEEDDPA
jgi:hypothetical protein